ncbi:hypothetical protein B0H14DRAFT_2609479 [Mycena olivaceomarginata]|nr:hypothetical protein B0H14DRAFT_2609479 [Mycena olivaceomarginata]
MTSRGLTGLSLCLCFLCRSMCCGAVPLFLPLFSTTAILYAKSPTRSHYPPARPASINRLLSPGHGTGTSLTTGVSRAKCCGTNRTYSKTVLDDTQYHLSQHKRRIIFAPTLADAAGFLHECEGFSSAFHQQVDGSFVRIPTVRIFYIVDGCSGDVFTSIAEAEHAWMDHGGAGDIRAVLDDYWQALECSLNPPYFLCTSSGSFKDIARKHLPSLARIRDDHRQERDSRRLKLYRTLAGPEIGECDERYLDMDIIYRVPSLRIVIVSYDTNFVFTRRVTYHSFAHRRWADGWRVFRGRRCWIVRPWCIGGDAEKSGGAVATALEQYASRYNMYGGGWIYQKLEYKWSNGEGAYTIAGATRRKWVGAFAAKTKLVAEAVHERTADFFIKWTTRFGGPQDVSTISAASLSIPARTNMGWRYLRGGSKERRKPPRVMRGICCRRSGARECAVESKANLGYAANTVLFRIGVGSVKSHREQQETVLHPGPRPLQIKAQNIRTWARPTLVIISDMEGPHTASEMQARIRLIERQRALLSEEAGYNSMVAHTAIMLDICSWSRWREAHREGTDLEMARRGRLNRRELIDARARVCWEEYKQRLGPPPPSITRRPGRRLERATPLTLDDLYLDDVRPPWMSSPPILYTCTLCFNLKSHPVL